MFPVESRCVIDCVGLAVREKIGFTVILDHGEAELCFMMLLITGADGECLGLGCAG